VPPVAEALQVNAFPFVRPLVGQLTVTTIGWPATLTVDDAVAVTELALVTLTLMVLLPFGEQVTEIVLAVEEPVHPVGRVHANV